MREIRYIGKIVSFNGADIWGAAGTGLEDKKQSNTTSTRARPFQKPPTNIALIWRTPHSYPAHFPIRSNRSPPLSPPQKD